MKGYRNSNVKSREVSSGNTDALMPVEIRDGMYVCVKV